MLEISKRKTHGNTTDIIVITNEGELNINGAHIDSTGNQVYVILNKGEGRLKGVG